MKNTLKFLIAAFLLCSTFIILTSCQGINWDELEGDELTTTLINEVSRKMDEVSSFTIDSEVRISSKADSTDFLQTGTTKAAVNKSGNIKLRSESTLYEFSGDKKNVSLNSLIIYCDGKLYISNEPYESGGEKLCCDLTEEDFLASNYNETASILFDTKILDFDAEVECVKNEDGTFKICAKGFSENEIEHLLIDIGFLEFYSYNSQQVKDINIEFFVSKEFKPISYSISLIYTDSASVNSTLNFYNFDKTEINTNVKSYVYKKTDNLIAILDTQNALKRIQYGLENKVVLEHTESIKSDSLNQCDSTDITIECADTDGDFEYKINVNHDSEKYNISYKYSTKTTTVPNSDPIYAETNDILARIDVYSFIQSLISFDITDVSNVRKTTENTYQIALSSKNSYIESILSALGKNSSGNYTHYLVVSYRDGEIVSMTLMANTSISYRTNPSHLAKGEYITFNIEITTKINIV